MNIQLNNFGPIKRFEFDLSKDLTIILGKNNIGKSYAISAVYLILKSFISDDQKYDQIEFILFYFRQNDTPEHFKSSRKLVKNILQLEEYTNRILNQNTQVEITNGLKEVFLDLLDELTIPNLEKSFGNSFDSIESLENKLADDKISFVVTFKSFEITISVTNNKFVISNLKFHEKVFIKKTSKKKKSERKENKYFIYYPSTLKNNSHIIDQVFIEYFRDFRNEIRNSIKNIYFLPASRSGLYQALSTFNAVIAELSKSRTFLSNKIELPNISEPVLDYFLSLANVNNNKGSKKFREIVELIERQILGGKVSFNNETKKLVFSPQKIETELDLAFTSSMISEIAPIVAFFKYIISDDESNNLYLIHSRSNADNSIKASNLIFIEEPEAHLHPEIQVKLMEAFSEIIKSNVKIVITTHSNYMFNKLSNLVLDNRVSYEKVGSYLMLMTENGSLNDTVSMAARQEGINDNNFADVAEQLYEERIQLYDKLNADVN